MVAALGPFGPKVLKILADTEDGLVYIDTSAFTRNLLQHIKLNDLGEQGITERERERERDIYIYISIYVLWFNHQVAQLVKVENPDQVNSRSCCAGALL